MTVLYFLDHSIKVESSLLASWSFKTNCTSEDCILFTRGQCPSSVLMLTQNIKFSSNRVKSGCWRVPEALISSSIRPILEKQLTFSLWMSEHDSNRLPGAWKKHCLQTGRAHCLLRELQEASWGVAWCPNTVGKDQQRGIKSKESVF